jgi:NAD(P)-dependent dehydrogenase (short-subunit alcohol dehydrogenase family)
MPGAVVIGAGPLIGRSVARRFAREGMPVSVIARTSQSIDQTVSAVRADGHKIQGYTADCTDELRLRAALDEVLGEQGVPEILVYNAALIRPDRLGELSAPELMDTLAVNVVGAVSAAAYMAPHMVAAGGGKIIITGGMPEPVPSYFSLSLGKAGVRSVTALLAQELGDSGVQVATVTVCGVVAPGTAYDPDEIAECYWELSQRTPDRWEQEVVFAR